MKDNDLSNLKVDYLSDNDIAKIEKQLKSNRVTIEQTESLVLSKGMSATEFTKLKTRLAVQKNMGTIRNKEEWNKLRDGVDRKQEKFVNLNIEV